jgi:DNA polymerase alpha subunit A
MVYTNSLNINDIMVIANNIKRAVNKKYRILEIEIDGVYKNMLLLKKKKYAALSLVNNTDGKKIFKKEVKGLDLVRRDWCVLSKVVGNFVLAQILSGEKQRDEMIETIHSHLRQLREDMMSDKIPLKKYVITKGLSKAPNEYPDANGQPHVQAALQMISMGKTVRVGDFIPYVVCEGEGPMAKRAYAPDMVTKSEGKLRVDRKWYLETQLLPPLARLTDPIEETDAARLADCLGLDAKNFHKYDKDDGEDDLVLATHQDDVERYKAADKLIVRCHKCEQDYAYTGVYRVPPFDLSAQSPDVIKRTFLPVVSGFACTNPKCGPILDQDDVRHTVANFTNTLTMQIRRHMSRYYEGWAVCNDNSCKYRSSQISTKDNQCPNVACNGVMVPEYNAADLYLQLSYFSYLFDMQRAEENVKSENKTREAAMIEYAQPQLRFELPRLDRIAMQNVFRFVQSWLQKSAYHYVDFSSIFGTRAPSKNPFAVGRANPMQLAH